MTTRQRIIDEMKVSMQRICSAARQYPEMPTEELLRASQQIYQWPTCRQEGGVQ